MCMFMNKGNPGVPGAPFLERQGNCNMPIDQLRIDNWPNADQDPTPYIHGVHSGPFRG